MRNGSAIANGVRQYAVTVPTGSWAQLEASPSATATPGLVANTGLAATMPVVRWRGQMGTGTDSLQDRSPYDYVQGLLIQNRSGVNTVYLTTTDDQTGGAPTARAVGNAIAIGPGASIKLDNTDATKIWLSASASTVVAVLCT